MSEAKQSFENHAKMVPGYHYVANGILLAVLVFGVYRVISDFTLDTLFFMLLVVAVMMIGFYARFFPLGVQDRVIRLEERLRLGSALPDAMSGRVGELTTEQLIALRFASDDEVAELTERVLTEGLADRKTIKKAVRDWRADHQRI